MTPDDCFFLTTTVRKDHATVPTPKKTPIMKRPLAFILTLFVAIALTGCGQSPRSTAKSFSENLAHGKISDAKKHATEQTGQLMDLASSFGGIPVEPNFKFIFVDQEVDGNSAVVRFRERPDGDVQSLNLVKIDGEWKVHMSK